MSKKNNQTTFLKTSEVKRNWFHLDATGKTLGRLATEIANILRGKHRADYTPYIDCGDGVIVINSDKIHVTGAKDAQKIYRYYTGSMSGMREIPYRTMKARDPSYIITHAVKGMMPTNRLSDKQLTRLRVFAGDQHTQEAQKPIQVNI